VGQWGPYIPPICFFCAAFCSPSTLVTLPQLGVYFPDSCSFARGEFSEPLWYAPWVPLKNWVFKAQRERGTGQYATVTEGFNSSICLAKVIYPHLVLGPWGGVWGITIYIFLPLSFLAKFFLHRLVRHLLDRSNTGFCGHGVQGSKFTLTLNSNL